MTLGYFAPLPPAPTGVAEYAEALAGRLREHVSLRLNQPGELNLYHIGNNALHGALYDRALAEPGVVLLHDACLHHLLLGRLSREQYIAEFVYNYGAWFEEAAARYWQSRGQSGADMRYFARPLLKRLCERARLVVVHNPAAARAVGEHAPTAPVLVLPHLFVPPPEYSYREIDTYREQVLGTGREACLFAVLGHLRESKRLAVVLRAAGRLVRAGVPLRLLVQGRFVGEELERALAPELAERWVLRRGYLPEAEWWLQAHALDAGLNLRWPLAGESSGIATRLMGIGRPVVLTRSLETEDLPEAAAIRIDPGLAEQEQLEHYMAWLALNPEARHSIGRHAAIHTREHHDAATVARSLLAALEPFGLTGPWQERYPEV
ncbi:MAG: glycosyltransferase [Bryobacter sp.]|jgi:glycosyltransferase involved in cell wall biosynthesis|nr:glycosyltransferase [Bryobacter sp. CoA8 C33]